MGPREVKEALANTLNNNPVEKVAHDFISSMQKCLTAMVANAKSIYEQNSGFKQQQGTGLAERTKPEQTTGRKLK